MPRGKTDYNSFPMSSCLKIWWRISVVILATTTLLPLVLPAGYALRAFGDITQTILPLILTFALARNMRVAHGRLQRAFWGLLASGAAVWTAASAVWTLYEVVWRRDVPVPFVGDVLFFMHIVPMMAAFTLLPHRSQSEPQLRLTPLDFSLLLSWWIYLYVLMVLPWQYVHPDVNGYSFNFNLLYVVENAALMGGVGILFYRAQGDWRRVYGHFLAASGLYVAGSQLVNGAIFRGTYYTGSLYDLPLTVSMCWYIVAALCAHKAKLEPSSGGESRTQTVIISRLAMGAVLSVPIFGAFGILFSSAPRQVFVFRIWVTLAAMLSLPVFVFLKQHFLAKELFRLLGISERNLENQKALQAQLVQTEKLTSLAQFVAGAAHEINNPLTAILGYSDLLLHDPSIPVEKQSLVGKMKQQAQRTRELVADLLKFSRSAPCAKSATDLNSLVANAIELRRLGTDAQDVEILTDFDPMLTPVWADSNQVLQVCFHIIGNALDAMRPLGPGVLTVRSWRKNDFAVLEFADTGPGVSDPHKIFDPFYTTKPVGKGTGLGLSAVYGIIREHRGHIMVENRPEGGATFTIMLPLAPVLAPVAV